MYKKISKIISQTFCKLSFFFAEYYISTNSDPINVFERSIKTTPIMMIFSRVL